jgi:hypothetical protein
VSDEHGRVTAWEWRDRALAAEDERDHWRHLARREAAEHDRLRTVVDAARDLLAVIHAAPPGTDLFRLSGHRATSALRGALDVSPTMGEPPTGEDHEPDEKPTADRGDDHGIDDDRAHPDSDRSIRDAGLSPNTGGGTAPYVCPDHNATGGYESCCECGGWHDDDPDRGRKCSEADG